MTEQSNESLLYKSSPQNKYNVSVTAKIYLCATTFSTKQANIKIIIMA